MAGYTKKRGGDFPSVIPECLFLFPPRKKVVIPERHIEVGQPGGVKPAIQPGIVGGALYSGPYTRLETWRIPEIIGQEKRRLIERGLRKWFKGVIKTGRESG